MDEARLELLLQWQIKLFCYQDWNFAVALVVCSLIAFAQAKIFLHFADSLFLSRIALGPLSIAASYPLA